MQSNEGYLEEFEPVWHDLEDQVARNEIYSLELDVASEDLRVQAVAWFLAAIACFFAEIGLAVLAFASIQTEQFFLRTYVGQTVVTTLLTLVLSAVVACFVRFAALRRLVGETYRVSQANQWAIKGAQELLKKIS